MRRKLVPLTLLGILTIGVASAAVAGALASSSPAHFQLVFRLPRYLKPPFFPDQPINGHQPLVGLTYAQAASIAHAEGVSLAVMHAPSPYPKGAVIGQDLNFQSNETVVVSDGPLKDKYQILSPATVPPVAAECGAGLAIAEDGSIGPFLCWPNHVNVPAWRNLASLHVPVLALGPNATEQEVRAIACAGPTTNIALSAYAMARAYYGWTFPDFSEQRGFTCQ